MKSLYELLTTDEQLDKQYQFLNDKLTDLFQSIYIDIVSNAPLIRWLITKDEFQKYNVLIHQLVSDMLNNYDEIEKMN